MSALTNLNRPISIRSILCRWDRQGGETLHSLARKHGIPVRVLQAAWKGREVSRTLREQRAARKRPPPPRPPAYYAAPPSPDLDHLQ